MKGSYSTVWYGGARCYGKSILWLVAVKQVRTDKSVKAIFWPWLEPFSVQRALKYFKSSPLRTAAVERDGTRFEQLPCTTPGPSWGYLKSQFQLGLSIFSDIFTQKRGNGSKNEDGIPREGPCVVRQSGQDPGLGFKV